MSSSIPVESASPVQPGGGPDVAAAKPAGTVHIVGAGPGPADLLTLRALDRIHRAEVVIHDRLIGGDVLALVPSQAEQICVGKAGAEHLVEQDDIHRLLVEHASRGRRVVRLKGGDPFIFGRGGEEVQALQAARLTFEIVPGVSASNGCGAAAGIPLTHRELAHSCTFLSGHLAAEGNVETSGHFDWTALARPNQTRVFYMGVAHIGAIARTLIAHGLPPETPAAVVQDGTRPTQQVWAMGLSSLVEHAPAPGPRPGLLIIGETVALSPHFQGGHASSPETVPGPRCFNAAERDAFYEVLAARRDMRHFRSDAVVDERVLERILQAAHRAPSVGLMQPWRFLRVLDPRLRTSIADIVERERLATSQALGDRSQDFLRLKVEGVRDCAELLVVALPPDDGTIFGRRTMPREMALCSVGCAVENLWLAARAENLGLGWVSMFEPAALANLLEFPEGALPVGILCIGPVVDFYPAPLLELDQWRQGRPLDEMVSTDRWCAADALPSARGRGGATVQ